MGNEYEPYKPVKPIYSGNKKGCELLAVALIIIGLLVLCSCQTIKKNIDSNYKAHSIERANHYKHVYPSNLMLRDTTIN